MENQTEKLSQDIEKLILSIQENIKQKNYSYLSNQIVNLNTLILNYLLALDYEIKSQNNNNISKIKDIININLQKISEYLKTKDEKLISEVKSSLSQIYNTLFEPQVENIPNWNETEEKLFFNTLQEISELSNKVYLFYLRKPVPKEEILKLAQTILNNIQKLPG